MAKAKTKKNLEVEAILQKLQTAKGVAVASYKGLKVQDSEKLRRQLKSVNGELLAVKKTLLAVALKQMKQEASLADLPGSLVVAFSYNDEITAAKLLADFIKTNQEVMSLEGGLVEGSVLDRGGIVTLANLPGRQELLAKMVGSLQSPISGMVGVLSGVMRQFVLTVAAIRDSKVN